MKDYVFGAFIALVGTVVAGLAVAAPLPAPAEKPILSISGNISVTNKDNAAQFDRAMLESMGMVTIETETPWYQGPVKFEGVPLAKLMDRVGASGKQAVVVALNDYSSEIPMEDFAKHNVVLALKVNGDYISVRDKGPLFIIYPFDSNPDLKNQTYYGRSVWQVAKIIVK
jgi:hypothetical protein